MRWLVGLMLAGCGAGRGSATDAMAAPDIDGIDIVVSSTRVVAWVGLTGALANTGRFAAPGTCGGTTDAIIVVQSCLGALEIAGTALTSGAAELGPANPYEAMVTVHAGSIFSAHDCGHTIEVPLHAGPFPRATSAQAIRSGTDIVVSWTADAPFT